MGNRAVFLDRDGTINVDKGYVYRIEDFEYIKGATDALKILNDTGFLLIIITNQSGIGRGYFTKEQYIELNDWLLHDLEQKEITIAATYYCPHHPQAKIIRYRQTCNCRKPKTALFEQAIREWDINPKESFAVGDKLRDLEICKTTDIRGFLIDSDLEDIPYKNIYAVQGGLLEAVRKIVSLTDGKEGHK